MKHIIIAAAAAVVLAGCDTVAAPVGDEQLELVWQDLSENTRVVTCAVAEEDPGILAESLTTEFHSKNLEQYGYEVTSYVDFFLNKCLEGA